MRFSVNIFLESNEDEIKVPKSYRKNLLSLIKESLQVHNSSLDLCHKYYSESSKKKNVPKPFTFSVQIPINHEKAAEYKKENFFLLHTNKNSKFYNILRFHFSSYDIPTLMHIYNGLVSLKNYPLFKHTKANFKNFYLEKEINFQDEAKFKIISPVLVRKIDLEKKEKTKFLRKSDEKNKNDEELKESLFNNIRYLTKTFIDENYILNKKDIEINFEDIKKAPAVTYNSEFGIKGILHIKAPKEILKLIYYGGLGAKKSQGYGLLEVLK